MNSSPYAVVRAAAPAQCLELYPNVLRPDQRVYENGLKLKVPRDTVLDLRGTTIYGMAGPNDALSILFVTGFENLSIVGGTLRGRQDPQRVTWLEGHRIYGAGLLLKGGKGRVTIENMVIENSLQDGITLAGGLDRSVTLELRATWIKGASDDGIQNDGGKRIVAIEDCLIESKMGLSFRPGADSGQSGGGHGSYLVPIRNTLFDVTPVADDRPDGSDRRNVAKAQHNNAGPGLAASQLFKWSGAARDVGIDMADCIVRFQARSRNGWGAMTWPKGRYRNVIVVWDPVQQGMEFEGELPDGVELVRDPSVWHRVRQTWLDRHGCDASGRCTWTAPVDPGPGPWPGPDPDPDVPVDPEPDPAAIALLEPEQITAARQDLGVTRAELALTLGVGKGSVVGDWERGETTIDPTSSQAIRFWLAARGFAPIPGVIRPGRA